MVFRPFQTSPLHLPAPPSGLAKGRPVGMLLSNGVTQLQRYYECSTPARGCPCGLLNLAHIPCSLPHRSLHVTCRTFRALRLQPPHRLHRSLCHLSCQRRRLPAHRGSRLRLSIGGSPVGTAELSSSSYGLPVRLALLPTPSHDDAVTVGYRSETGIPEGDLHLSDVARLWTHGGRVTPGHDGVDGPLTASTCQSWIPSEPTNGSHP